MSQTRLCQAILAKRNSIWLIGADFLGLVDEISETVAVPGSGEPQSESQSAFIHPAREVRAAMDKLISRIDTLESDFDKLAEKSSACFRFRASLTLTLTIGQCLFPPFG